MKKLMGPAAIGIFALASAVTASAQTTTPPSTAQATPPAASSAAPAAAPTPAQVAADERIVCKKTEQLGSRLRGQRICRTVADWRSLAQNASQQTKRVQSQGNYGPPEVGKPGGG
jgi:hypothetical protein